MTRPAVVALPRPKAEEPIAADPVSADTVVAVRNAVLLFFSLLGTWGVTLAVRLFLPRFLGPETFGVYTFADSFAGACFAFLVLGLDTYIRKVIPVRPEHASDFFGGVLAVRVSASFLLLLLILGVLVASGRPGATIRLAMIFGVAQLAFTTNTTLAALLHASQKVGGLAVVNVTTKLLWAAGIAAVLFMGLPLEALGAAFLLGESVKTALLWRLAREHLGLVLRIDRAATRAAILDSLPFYLNAIAVVAYTKIDVTVLSYLTSNTEIGYYSAAQSIAGFSMFISPLIGWVLMPLLARAEARSREELFARLRRALELVITLVMPLSALVALGSDVIVPLLFGEAYSPAIRALAVLAPMFVLTYFATLASTALILLDRAWTVTVISAAALAAMVSIDVVLIPRTEAWLGAGGAGVGAAAAMVLTQILVAIGLAARIGRQVVDARSVNAVIRSAAVVLSVVLLDRVALHELGGLRLVVDGLLFAGLSAVTRAVRLEEINSMLRAQLRGAHGRVGGG